MEKCDASECPWKKEDCGPCRWVDKECKECAWWYHCEGHCEGHHEYYRGKCREGNKLKDANGRNSACPNFVPKSGW